MSEIENLLPCPFCGGNFSIAVCDDEGNIHDEAGYQQNPWSGLGYKIIHSHEENENCPIANYSEDGAEMGIWIYGTREEAIEAINRRTQPENKPLSLEELYLLVGKEPIYAVSKNIACWCVLDTTLQFGGGTALVAIYGRNMTLSGGDYGKTWLAYANKPEQEEK